MTTDRKAAPGSVLRDAFVFGGLLLVAFGSGAIYWPAGLIVLGCGLFGLGMLAAR